MKRRGVAFVWILIGLVSFPAAPSDPAPDPTGELPGAWEGFIAESPARLTRFVIELTPTAGGWEGTIDLPGAVELPLSAIRIEDADLHFELRTGDSRVVFDGEVANGRISGRLVEEDRSFPFDLRKLPEYPKPTDRVEAWQQDLEVVRTRFLEYDRSFDPEAKISFARAIDELDASLRDMNDQQIIVALSKAVASSGNAHTRLYLLRNRTELRRLPIRVYWFSDGLFVVRASEGLGETLGCRVARAAGLDPIELRDRVARLFAGNPSWVEYKSPYFMTSPEILYGLGLIENMESVPFRFDCADREPFEREIAPLPLHRETTPTEAWRELSPSWHDDPGARESALTTATAPLYLRDPYHPYWLEYLEGRKALYLQYNRSQDMPEGPTFAEFAAEVEHFAAQHPIEAFILDLRFNTGGNSEIAAGFMKELVALEKKKQIGRLYVITGRATFSAGISHAAYLKQYSAATFVGEPIGDKLDTWSEGGNIVLPNSRLTVHFTNGFHSLSRAAHPEYEPYVWADLDLTDLVPDVLVRASSGDYFSGRDPVLEAILAIEADLDESTESGG